MAKRKPTSKEDRQAVGSRMRIVAQEMAEKARKTGTKRLQGEAGVIGVKAKFE